MAPDVPASVGSVLTAAGIIVLLDKEPPLLAPVADRGEQVQPNGFDLTLESVWRIDVRVEKPSAPVSAAPSGLVAVEIHRTRKTREDADVP